MTDQLEADRAKGRRRGMWIGEAVMSVFPYEKQRETLFAPHMASVRQQLLSNYGEVVVNYCFSCLLLGIEVGPRARSKLVERGYRVWIDN